MRNPFFDVLKFFAILLVVYGHVGGAFGCSFGSPFINNFIVGVNMPLFFALSGYFSAKTIEVGDWKKLGRHLVGYFWPAASISVVFAVFVIGFHLPECENGLIGYAVRRFFFAAWFLWCLAICFVLTFVCMYPKSNLIKGVMWLMVLLLLPSVSGMWHGANVREMLPHFCFGALVLRRWESWKNWKVGAGCLLLYLITVAVPNGATSNWRSFYGQPSTWAAFLHDGRLAVFYLARLANGMIGTLGIMWLFQVAVERSNLVARLAPLGRTTLGVYLLHHWLLMRVVDVGWGVPFIGYVILWTGILFVVCHHLVALTKRPVWCRRMIWGEWW